MPLASIPLTSLNNLINSSSLNPSDGFPGQDDRLTCSSGSGCVSGAGCEGVRDVHRVGVAPDTPQRASQTNPGQFQYGHYRMLYSFNTDSVHVDTVPIRLEYWILILLNL